MRRKEIEVQRKEGKEIRKRDEGRKRGQDQPSLYTVYYKIVCTVTHWVLYVRKSHFLLTTWGPATI